jgi:hypothetical protein
MQLSGGIPPATSPTTRNSATATPPLATTAGWRKKTRQRIAVEEREVADLDLICGDP